jgi:hypothetical protein
MVLSIIAIVKASKVTRKWLNQQHTEAYQDSRSAKILGLIALIWAIVVTCLIIVAYFCFYLSYIGVALVSLLFA